MELNNFDLDELLNEALKPTEEPSDILNAKLKQKIKKKKLYTGRRIFEFSAVGVAAVVAIFAIALNVNNNFGNKVENVPILGDISQNDKLIADADNKPEQSFENAKNDDENNTERSNDTEKNMNEDSTVTQSKANMVIVSEKEESSAKSDFNEKNLQAQDTKTYNAEKGTDIIINSPAESAEPVPQTEEDIMPKGKSVSEPAQSENENNDVSVASSMYEESEPVLEASMFSADIANESDANTSGGGGSSSGASITAVPDVLPVTITADDVKTLTDENGKKYSVDKNTKQRVTIGSIFEEGYDYNTYLYLEIIGQMNESKEEIYFIDGNNAFDEITGNEDFYIDGNNDLYITFDKGEVASESIGTVEFNVGNIN